MPLRPLTTLFLLLLALSSVLAGCGRRGELEPPAGNVASTAAPASPSAADAGEKASKDGKSSKVAVPDRHFILDPLIQ